MSTGLIRVTPAGMSGKSFAAWLNALEDPDLPLDRYPKAYAVTINGCPLSQGAHRTYYLEAGDYFLATLGASYQQKCDNFNVKMTCSDGGETASPADSNPLGFSVDANTGAITGVPERPRRDGSPYKMRLRAVDAANVRKQLPTLFVQWESNGFMCACAPLGAHKLSQKSREMTSTPSE